MLRLRRLNRLCRLCQLCMFCRLRRLPWLAYQMHGCCSRLLIESSTGWLLHPNTPGDGLDCLHRIPHLPRWSLGAYKFNSIGCFNMSSLQIGCFSRWQTKKCRQNKSKSVGTWHATVGCVSRQHIIQTHGCVNRSHTNAKSNRSSGLMDGWMDMPMDRWIDGRMDGRHFFRLTTFLNSPRWLRIGTL